MRAVLRLAEKNGIAVEERDADAIENLAGEHAQGVAALSDPPPMVAESELKNMCAGANANGESGGEGDLPLFVVIDRVWDPRNLGACLRSAAACSVTAVVVPKAHVSALSPTVLRASAGMAARVPVVRASNLARCLQGLRDSGIWIAGLDSGAPDSLYAFDCRRPLAFVLGSEGKGMRQLTRAQCDYHISIPMSGAVESLNLSVATAVCLFEASRQRTQAP